MTGGMTRNKPGSVTLVNHTGLPAELLNYRDIKVFFFPPKLMHFSELGGDLSLFYNIKKLHQEFKRLCMSQVNLTAN